jgi:hypothetical protein
MHDDHSFPVLKWLSAIGAAGLSRWHDFWAFFGVTSWTEAAAMSATIYSLILIAEWWWKKFWRPLFERLGWLKRTRRRSTDHDLRPM